MGITYLVTGGTHQLGYSIIKELHNRNCRIRALVAEDNPNINLISDMAEIFYGDVKNVNSLESFFDCPSTDDIYVIHCDTDVTTSTKFEQEVWDTNVAGTKNIINYSKTYHVTRMVYVTSVLALPENDEAEIITETNEYSTRSVSGMYAKTTAAASMIVMDACKEGLNASVVHHSALLGPDDYENSALTKLIYSYLQGTVPVNVEGGYDFVDVRDVALGTLSCLEKGRSGESYILSNRYITFKNLFDIIYAQNEVKEVYLTVPNWIIKISSPTIKAFSKLSGNHSLYTEYSFSILSDRGHFSHEKATAELNYHPRSIYETMDDMIAFVNEVYLADSKK